MTGNLTKRAIPNLGPGMHSDGNGLYLCVAPSGSMSWILRVTIRGQRTVSGSPRRIEVGLGGLSYTDLGEAREKALPLRKLAKAGINPLTQVQDRDIPTFAALCETRHKELLPTWKNPKHGQQWINTLQTYAFPHVGQLRVSEIGQPEVLKCLLPIWIEKPETARRVMQRMGSVLDVAQAKGFREGQNPVEIIRKANVLPKHGKAQAVKHHAAMKWQNLPEFYSQLSGREGMAAQALQFTILTASRSGEVRGALWSEIDLSARLWTIPAERMKAHREHVVPLTEPCMSILEGLRGFSNPIVFEGQKRGRSLSDMSLLAVLKRMDLGDITVHGFRSTFRDWAAEAARADREVAEQCLAHSVGNKVEAAYKRSDLLERRRELMTAWGRFVTGDSADVLQIGRANG
ncbi:MAG: integrase arm-type DNA-binding domain-containing protein [Alphaproteobacteria bacterium]|nr:integrase arm-type DNA-binding domain-containing protein [Alphaproteobacteria bacterium]